MSLDNCPTCDRRITDFDANGCELDNAQRWCLDHLREGDPAEYARLLG